MASSTTQGLLLQITGDASGAVAAAQSAAEAVTGLAGTMPGLASAMDAPGEAGQQLGATLQEAFKNPIGAISDLTSSIGGMLTEALGALGPIGEAAAGGIGLVAAAAIGVGAAVFGLADEAANAGEEVLGFSEKTGIAVENVGPLQFAVQAAGGSLDTLSTIFRSIDMKAATDQGGNFSAALKDMGINAATFKAADPETQLLMLGDAMRSGAAGGNLMNDMLAIGGRQLVNQIPLIEKLTSGLLQTGAALGVVWTPAQTEDAEAFSLGVGTIKTAIEDIAIKIGQAMLPALSDMVVKFASSPAFIDAVTLATSMLATSLSSLIKIITPIGAFVLKDLVGPLAQAGEALEALHLATDAMSGSAANIKADGEAVQFFTQIAANAKPAADGLYNAGEGAAKGLDDLADHAKQTAQAIQADLNKSMNESGAAGAAMQKAIDGIAASLEGDSKKTQEEVAALQQVVGVQNLDTEAKARAVDMIEQLMQAGVPLTAQITDFYNANVGLSKSYQDLIKTEDEYVKASSKSADEFVAKWLAAQAKFVAGEVSAYQKGLDAQNKAMQTSADKFAQVYLADNKLIATASTDLTMLQGKQTESLYQQQVDAVNKWAQQQLAAFQAEQDKSGETSDVLQAQAIAYGKVIQAEVTAKIAAIGPAWASTLTEVSDDLAKALGGIQSDFSAIASSSSGAMKVVADDLGTAVSSFKAFSAAGKDFSTGGFLNDLSGITGLVSGAIQLGEALWNSVFGLNATQTALQNLGVTVKNQMFGDPWIAQQTNELEQLQGQAALTAPTISDLFSGVEAGGSQATAALQTLTTLLPTIDKNFSLASQTSAGLLQTIKTGGPEATASMTALNAQVTDFQSQASTTSGVWSPAFETLIEQSQEAGQNIASITSALQTQTTNLTSGLNSAFQVTLDAQTAAAADQKVLADTSSSVADVAAATADLANQNNILAGTQVNSAAAAQGQAAAVVASVDANMKAGQTFVQAVTAAQPAIQGLQAQLTATGYSGGAAFQLLSSMATLATGAVSGPLLKAVEGNTQAVTALANMGQITQGTFSGLESQIGQTYTSLIQGGADSKTALAAIQPDLQTAWQLEQQYGVTADSVTQSLINQASQQGLVGTQQESSTQQMVDALNGVKSDLDEVVQKMIGVGAAAETAAGRVNGAFSSIQSPTVNLNVVQTVSTVPGATLSTGDAQVAASTSGVPVADIPLSTVGTSGLVYVRAGVDVVGVPQAADLSALAPGASASAFGAGSFGGESGGGNVFNVNFSIQAMDGDSVARWLQNGGTTQIIAAMGTGANLSQVKRMVTRAGFRPS
jgi:hypothetical protein